MSKPSPQKSSPAKTSGSGGVTCNVVLLDGENLQISLAKNDTGRVLFDKVCESLDLIEKDYFGFTYADDRGPSNIKFWLNLDKKVSSQKKRGAWVFDFAVKFYPPDPSQLRESLTRWLIVLQVRRDLLSGRLPCTFTTYAILGAYNVQADVGEYDPNDHGNSYDYIRNMTFAPNQTPELLEKIAELHKQHKGQTPDEAEKCFLDNAKKLAMYGVDLHRGKDADNNPVMIGVSCSGILIYKDKLRLNRFVWPKILKLSYKRNHFYIKIRPGESERGEATIMFKLDNHRLAKRLWKTCVEHHAFFRLRESEKPTNNVSFPRFGSKFRYSGRTLYQTRQNAALLDRPPPFFERSQPNRYSTGDSARSHSLDESTEDGKRRPGSRSDDDGTLQRRPYETDSLDRRDRVPNQGDATLERNRGKGDDSMGVIAGNLEKESEKEKRKREKEEDKRRKKEAEEKRKADKKKKGKDLDASEDRADKMDGEDATLTRARPGAGGVGLEDPSDLYYKDGSPYDRNGQGPLYDRFGDPLYDKFGRPYDKGSLGHPFDRNNRPYDKDGKGFMYDKDGNLLFDKDGRPYTSESKGAPYDKDGNLYDKNGPGYMYDKDGFPLDEKDAKPYTKDSQGTAYDRHGRPYESAKGYMYDRDGNLLFDRDGLPFTKYSRGMPEDRDGKPYDRDGEGYIYDREGNPLYEQDGKPYTKNSKPLPYDKYGRPYDVDGSGRGIMHDRDGNVLTDQSGEPYTMDSRGLPFDRDGNPYDLDGKGFFYDNEGNPLYEKNGTPYTKDTKAQPYDKYGRPYESDGKGYLYDPNGNLLFDAKDVPYTKDSRGVPYNRDGSPYDEQGQGCLCDKDGNPLFEKSGSPYTKNSPRGEQPYDRFGRPYESDGKAYLYDKDGNLLFDKNGLPYSATSTGPPYNKDGSLYDPYGKGYLYDKDQTPLYDQKAQLYTKDSEGYPHYKNGKPYDTPSKDLLYDPDGRVLYDKDGKPYNMETRGYPYERPEQFLDGKENGGLYKATPLDLGLGMGARDMTGVVGNESQVDNVQHFMPLPKPIKESKDSLKSDNLMPFFSPDATSTVGRGKVPPPVPPKHNHSAEDGFNYKTEKDGVEQTRVVQKVVVSGEEEDDFDFDAALADAIRSVTEFNPDMSVERIECVQQIEDVKDGN